MHRPLSGSAYGGLSASATPRRVRTLRRVCVGIAAYALLLVASVMVSADAANTALPQPFESAAAPSRSFGPGATSNEPGTPGGRSASASPEAGNTCGDANLSDFTIKISFSFLNGECAPGAHLVLSEARGQTLIDVVTSGGPVYANIPTGDYVVTATYKGQRLEQRFTVVHQEQFIAHFAWPAQAPEDGSLTAHTRSTAVAFPVRATK
jgi:hypothetical protein